MIKKILSIVLIAASLFIGYLGVKDYRDSMHSVKVLGVQLEAQDNTVKETAYIELIFAVAAFAGGILLLRSDKKN